MRLLSGIGILLALALPASARQDTVKDPDGKTMFVVVDCRQCADPAKSETCETGVPVGTLDGAPCGGCLIDANLSARPRFGYDVTLRGLLTNEKGEPVKNHFVKLYTPSFGVRTKTTSSGAFYLRIGASADRKSKTPVIHDLGTRTLRQDSKSSEYAIFLLPDGYKACAARK